MRSSKKGYVGDVMTMSATLIAVFVLLSLCIFLMIKWNDGVQSSSAFTEESKAAQQEFTDTYPGMMAWFFPIVFIGMILYTLITAYLVDVISRVWFVIGFVMIGIQAIVSYVIQQTYEKLSEVSIFGTGAAFIPGAQAYFGNVILWNSIIGFLILLALYFKRDA